MGVILQKVAVYQIAKVIIKESLIFIKCISSSMVQRLGFIAFTDTAGVRLPVGEYFAQISSFGVRSLFFAFVIVS